MRDLIEDGIRRILQDQVTDASQVAARQGGWDAALWALLEEGGFTRALCRSEHGGSDASWSDVYPLLVASGYHGLPLPLPETLLASRLLERAGIAPPPGPLGIVDGGDAGALLLAQTADGWTVYGELRHVPFGRHCPQLVAQVMHGEQAFLVLLPTEGLESRPNENLAREPRDTFLARGARPLALAPWSGGANDALRLHGALLRSAQTAGAAQRALELAVRYAGDRVQFGRPLARFQAVQQQIAQAVSELAAVTAAAENACEQADQNACEQADGVDAACAIAVARITAAEAAGMVAAAAHAVHGAMGYTAEHPLHHATQRLWSWRSEFGNLHWWSQRLGQAICARGADDAWHAMVDGRLSVRLHAEETA